MTDLNRFAVTRKWPARHPERLQLYSMPTPNGVKAAIMLEETGLPYEVHRVAFEKDEQHAPEYLALNPNNKIPSIIDPDGPDGAPLPLWESGAILLYLAEKTGRFLPQDAARRYETIQWLMFQIGGIGPMFGQFGYFYKMGGKDIEDPRPREHFLEETKRLLQVLEGRLEGRGWIMGEDYTIADIATFPRVNGLLNRYAAGDLVEADKLPNVRRVLQAFLARPAVAKGLQIPAAPQA